MTKSERLDLVLKNIKELEVLVRGMEAMPDVPAIVQNLALVQTRNIYDGLANLALSEVLKEQLAHVENLADCGVVDEIPKETIEEKQAETPKEEPIAQPEIQPEIQPEPAPQLEPVAEPEEELPVVEERAEEPSIFEPEAEKTASMEEVEQKNGAMEEKNNAVQIVEKEIEPQPVVAEAEKKAEVAPKKGTDIAADEDKEAQEKCNPHERFRTAVRSLNETIQRKPETRFVVSLKKAINLNDRFRYQRELFGGNAEAMNTAIEQLDAMPSLSDAMTYVAGLGWADTEASADFIALLEARFARAN